MVSTVTSDFNLGSEEHCFFCLNKILVEAQQVPQFQKFSVHYLARYLEMDMGKTLIEEGQRDSALLAKIRKSRLKVELCEKCTSLNHTFSGLYQQLEKVEIEIKCNLRLINQEMVGADQSYKYGKTPDLNSSMSKEISQIVDVLREEAIQKCAQKLDVLSPRVKIGKLTKKQIHAELSKHQTNSEIATMDLETSLSKKSIEIQGNVKEEFELRNENLLGDNDSQNYDMDGEAMDEEDHASITEGPLDSSSSNDKNLENDVNINKNSLVIIPAAPKSRRRVEQGEHSINLGNGSWKCSACSLELTTCYGIRLHYRSVHQNIRFKCVPCGKEFVHKHVYDRHHQSVHVGVKFKCLICNKLFTYKDNLRKHQHTSGCRKGTH